MWSAAVSGSRGSHVLHTIKLCVSVCVCVCEGGGCTVAHRDGQSFGKQGSSEVEQSLSTGL